MVYKEKKKKGNGKKSPLGYFEEFRRSAAEFGVANGRIDKRYPHLEAIIRSINSDERFISPELKDEPYSPLHPLASKIFSWVPEGKGLFTSRDYVGIGTAVAKNPKIKWISTVQELEWLIKKLERHRIVYCDIECHNVCSYRGVTCIIQLYVGGSVVFIVDTLKLFNHMRLLNQVFMDKGVMKVFYGAGEDMKCLERDFGVYVVGLLDLQVLVNGTLDRNNLTHGCGLEAALEKTTKQSVSKKLRNADFRVRPLPKELAHYASMDVYVLPRLMKYLLELRNKHGQIHKKSILRTAVFNSRKVAMQRYIKSTNSSAIVSGVSSDVDILDFMRDLIGKNEDMQPKFILPDAVLQEMAMSKWKSNAHFVETFTGFCQHLDKYIPYMGLVHVVYDKDVVIDTAMREINRFLMQPPVDVPLGSQPGENVVSMGEVVEEEDVDQDSTDEDSASSESESDSTALKMVVPVVPMAPEAAQVTANAEPMGKTMEEAHVDQDSTDEDSASSESESDSTALKMVVPVVPMAPEAAQVTANAEPMSETVEKAHVDHGSTDEGSGGSESEIDRVVETVVPMAPEAVQLTPNDEPMGETVKEAHVDQDSTDEGSEGSENEIDRVVEMVVPVVPMAPEAVQVTPNDEPMSETVEEAHVDHGSTDEGSGESESEIDRVVETVVPMAPEAVQLTPNDEPMGETVKEAHVDHGSNDEGSGGSESEIDRVVEMVVPVVPMAPEAVQLTPNDEPMSETVKEAHVDQDSTDEGSGGSESESDSTALKMVVPVVPMAPEAAQVTPNDEHMGETVKEAHVDQDSTDEGSGGSESESDSTALKMVVPVVPMAPEAAQVTPNDEHMGETVEEAHADLVSMDEGDGSRGSESDNAGDVLDIGTNDLDELPRGHALNSLIRVSQFVPTLDSSCSGYPYSGNLDVVGNFRIPVKPLMVSVGKYADIVAFDQVTT